MSPRIARRYRRTPARAVPARPAGRRLSLVLGAFLIATACLAPRARAAGAVYYVSPAGSDANAGSAAAPFRQIRRALQVVRPGDNVQVADGTYLGFDVGVNGTAAAPITIRAVGTDAQVVPTTDRPDNRDTIKISGASYFVIDGLRSFNANRAAVRIDNSPRVTIRNGVFGNNTVWGIFTDFSDDTVLENNECYGSVQQHGIYVSNSSQRPIIRDNQCHNNADCGIQINADVTLGGIGLTEGAVIEKNIIHDNGAAGGAAINLDGAQNSTVVNNLLYNNHAGGIVAYKNFGAAGPQGMTIYHNTVDMPSGSRWALNFGSCTGMNTVRNNILLDASANHGGITYDSQADVSLVDSDYNIQDRITPDGGATVYTLANWQSMGHELHSLSASAASLFVSPGVDYHLKAGSPAIDRGQTLAAVTTDLDGDRRPIGAASDIGCDEFFGAAAPPAAPANLSAAAGNAQVSLTWNASAGAAGYNVKRATVSGGPYATLASKIAAASYTDQGLTNGTTYYYVVSAVNASGESANSAQASATPKPPPPAAPANVKAVAGNAQVTLSWTASVGATSYTVQRATISGGPYAPVPAGINIAATLYTDPGLSNGTTYYYVVTAANSSGSSPNSVQVSATPVAGSAAPAAPTGVIAKGQIGYVIIGWKQSTSAGVAQNRVYRSQVSGGPYALIATVNATSTAGSYLDRSVVKGTIYYYVVTAVNSAGAESHYSNQASAAGQ